MSATTGKAISKIKLIVQFLTFPGQICAHSNHEGLKYCLAISDLAIQQADQTHPSIVLVDPYSNMYAFKIHVFQRPPSSDVCDRADIDCLYEEQNDDDHALEL